MTTNTALRPVAVVVVFASLAFGCSSTDEPATGSDISTVDGSTVVAETASFDLSAGDPQRYLLGLFSNEGGSIVDGEISLDFSRLLGEEELPSDLQGVSATFVAVAGSEDRTASDTPHVATPGEGTGAYQADDVTFDEPGNWRVTATVPLESGTVTVTDAFEVHVERVVPAPGEPAPRTENRVAGDPDVDATAIDSRAENGEVPDPELHSMTVADAVASGRPTMVAVTTPTFCVSRFCGPITDTVQELAADYGERVNFVHLEVWRNYEELEVNASAAEWFLPDGVEGEGGNEPWVFLVGADGTILQRWDNVTNKEQLGAALDSVT